MVPPLAIQARRKRDESFEMSMTIGISGFTRKIGQTTSIAAEFWAIQDGLQLALSLGVQDIEVELDAHISH